MATKKKSAYRVANPRGIPQGIPILAHRPLHDVCHGEGCENCQGGRVTLGEWFEGDAIDETFPGFRDYLARGFIEVSDG